MWFWIGWALGFVALAALIAAGVYAVMLYNSLVQVRHGVDQAWANIDVLLKQRLEELTKLLDAVKTYMTYEQALLTRVTELRARAAQGGADAARIGAERELGDIVGRLFIAAEAYPDLKASNNFIELQRRISALEEQLAHRREFYNDAVNINNVRREQFPDRLLIGLAGLVPRALFEASALERGDVNVAAGLART